MASLFNHIGNALNTGQFLFLRQEFDFCGFMRVGKEWENMIYPSRDYRELFLPELRPMYPRKSPRKIGSPLPRSTILLGFAGLLHFKLAQGRHSGLGNAPYTYVGSKWLH